MTRPIAPLYAAAIGLCLFAGTAAAFNVTGLTQTNRGSEADHARTQHGDSQLWFLPCVHHRTNLTLRERPRPYNTVATPLTDPLSGSTQALVNVRS